jgi:hypothetical protein
LQHRVAIFFCKIQLPALPKLKPGFDILDKGRNLSWPNVKYVRKNP